MHKLIFEPFIFEGVKEATDGAIKRAASYQPQKPMSSVSRAHLLALPRRLSGHMQNKAFLYSIGAPSYDRRALFYFCPWATLIVKDGSLLERRRAFRRHRC
jgi:hypothetical protein